MLRAIRRLRIVSRAAVATIALSRGGVRAASPSDEAMAEKLFRDGKALLDEGHLDAACAKLAESQRLAPAGGTLLNVGACHARQGLNATALGELSEALAIARREGRADRARRAQDEIDRLTPLLDTLTIRVSDAARVDGLVVAIDGTPIGRAAWETALPIDPGTHELEFRAPGRAAATRTISVGRARDAVVVDAPTLAVVAVVVPEKRADPAPTRAASLRTTTILGWSTVALGVAGLVVGGVFYQQAGAAHDDATALWSQRDPAAYARQDDANGRLNVARISLGVGVAALATGAVVLVLDRDSKLEIVPSPTIAGLTLRGAF